MREREWRVSAPEAEYLNQLAGAHCSPASPISVDYTRREIMIAHRPSSFLPFLLSISSPLPALFASATLKHTRQQCCTTGEIVYRLLSALSPVGGGRRGRRRKHRSPSMRTTYLCYRGQNVSLFLKKKKIIFFRWIVEI